MVAAVVGVWVGITRVLGAGSDSVGSGVDVNAGALNAALVAVGSTVCGRRVGVAGTSRISGDCQAARTKIQTVMAKNSTRIPITSHSPEFGRFTACRGCRPE